MNKILLTLAATVGFAGAAFADPLEGNWRTPPWDDGTVPVRGRSWDRFCPGDLAAAAVRPGCSRGRVSGPGVHQHASRRLLVVEREQRRGELLTQKP